MPSSREEALELVIVDRIENLQKLERWDIFMDLDLAFEEIAADAYERLQRSISTKDLDD